MLYKPKENFNQEELFYPGHNCTCTAVATHGSMLVDCANYYRDLHESLTKARHSIFILGWDIDSRIELIRKQEDRVHDTPVTLYELLTLKARENPDLQIYMNKWDYAFFMASTREPGSVWKWRKVQLPNIHYCYDGMVPSGACHHQKIIVVDDEVAFIGGMDVAIARWDTRDHIPDDPHRVDPMGIFKPNGRKEFKPYHDIQTVVSGEAAQELAKICRERWVKAAGYEAIPMREIKTIEGRSIYPAWPDTDPPDFEEIPVAIARTLPKYAGFEGSFEIEKAYLDEIATAEHFIYMENQYFTSLKIAKALNQRMHERPDLRVLLVSSYDPQGFIEKVSMWSGRIKFRKVIEEGGCGKQVCLAYPASRHRNGSGYQSVRIHSKIITVDDRLLSVGSANLNNRSMRLDTECDLIYQGETDAQREKIADIRNDLIHEHSGYGKDVVAQMVAGKVSPQDYSGLKDHNKQLVKINDMEFFARFPTSIAKALGDPDRSLVPELLPLPASNSLYVHYLTKRKVLAVTLLCAFVIAGALFWQNGLFSDIVSKEKLIALFESVESSEFAVLGGIAAYTVCAVFFIPSSLLTGVTGVIFGYWYGLLVSYVGALLAAAIGYGLGRGFGGKFPHLLSGGAMERIREHAENANVIGLTFLRMIPVAPFTVVNIALGFLKVPFLVFMAASFFGFMPGKIVAVFLADSLGDLWKNPDPGRIALVVAGLAAWVGVVWGTHYFYKKWQQKNKPKEA